MTNTLPSWGRIMMRKLQKGIAAVEFSIVAPLLILLLFCLAEFGWLLVNSVMVMNVASSGARFFASQRGTTTPYTDTKTQIQQSAAYLTVANLSYSTSVGNTPCSADATCAVGLNNAVLNGAVTDASVTVTYSPYKPLLVGSFPGITNLLPSSLSFTVVERTQ